MDVADYDPRKPHDEATPLLVSQSSPSVTSGRSASQQASRVREAGAQSDGLKGWLKDVCLFTYGLVIIFALPGMLGALGMTVEMPLLVSVQPEGWAIPSYFILFQRFGSLIALVYTTFTRFVLWRRQETCTIYTVVTSSAIFFILQAIFWHTTTMVAGSPHSTAFLGLVVAVAIADSTAAIFCLGFMANVKAQYISAFYIGQSSSGLLTALLAFVQGVPAASPPACEGNDTSSEDVTPGYSTSPLDQTRFSLSVFCIILSCLYLCSATAFSFLKFSARCSRDRVSEKEQVCSPDENQAEDLAKNTDPHKITKSRMEICCLVGLHVFAVTSTGAFVPTLCSYSSLPYGSSVYSTVAKARVAVMPVSGFISLFTPRVKTKTIALCALIGLTLTVYITYLAAVSPYPPLKGQVIGGIIVIVACVLHSGFMTYVEATTSFMLRNAVGKRALVFCKSLTYFVSTLIAVVLFVLISVLHVFKDDSDMCPKA